MTADFINEIGNRWQRRQYVFTSRSSRFIPEGVAHTYAEEPPSAPELDAVVAAAEQRLRALASEDPLDAGPLAEALADAATAAIASGQPIADIARAEQRGQQQARTALSRDLLARVERAARRRRDAEHDLHQAIARTARLGLPQREIAAAARLAPGTIRAIVANADDHGGMLESQDNGTPISESVQT